MEIISLTPNSPYCRDFEDDNLLSFAWISDLSGCRFNGVLVDGVLVARMAWQVNPSWCPEKNVVGIVSLETLHKFRCRGYGKVLVEYLRSTFPSLSMAFEINTPFAHNYWQRYQPHPLGKGRGNSYLWLLPPLSKPLNQAYVKGSC